MNFKQMHSSFRDVKTGNNVTIVQPSNIYGCTLNDSVFVGPFVEIQKGVVIGAYTKIQSHSFICENVTIGEHCFIGHGVMFVNDMMRNGSPANHDHTLWEKTLIGSNVSIGSNATILAVTIADGCLIGAGSVVTKSLRNRGIYIGNPARLLRTL